MLLRQPYYLALRDIICFCVLSICLIMSTSAGKREESNALQVAHELQINHDYVDSQILQSRMLMLDIVAPITSNTQKLTLVACLQAGVVCEKEQAPFKYMPTLKPFIPQQPINGDPDVQQYSD